MMNILQKFLASTTWDCQGHGKKENLETVESQKTKEIRWQNAMWYPGLGPVTEKGH